jgi:hypothetical protein
MPVGDCHGNYVTTLIVELEVTILDANRHRMTAWTRVPCSVNDGKFDPLGVPRLDGPAVRDLLYIGSAPDGRKMTYLATSKADLMLPELDLVKTPPSSIPRSRYIDPNTRTQVAGPSVPVGPLRPGYKRRLPMPPAASGVPP